jgi:hypothetical protein
LDRTSTGWIAPACLAHSFDYLVGAGKQRCRNVEAERLGGSLLMTNSYLVGIAPSQFAPAAASAA